MRIRVIGPPIPSGGDPETVTRWWRGITLEVLRTYWDRAYGDVCVVDGEAALIALGRMGTEAYKAADYYRRQRTWRIGVTFEFPKNSWEEV